MALRTTLQAYCSMQQSIFRVATPSRFYPDFCQTSSIKLLRNFGNGSVRQGNGVGRTQELKFKQEFIAAFPEVKASLVKAYYDPRISSMSEWLGNVLEGNVKGGKLNRGLTVVSSYSILTSQHTQQPATSALKEAIILGWALEIMQAFFLVADDIMDGSVTRRGQPCWYLSHNLGAKAFNDAVLLDAAVYKLVNIYCKNEPYYVPVVDLFHEMAMKTALGQSLDLHSAPDKGCKPNLPQFTPSLYNAIAQYKTAYYSFYLPVALAMHMVGIDKPELFCQAEDILLRMGNFFQVQDDYLDCFGDPKSTGKIGTDIQDGKCTWLVVQALQRAGDREKDILQECYGSDKGKDIERVKAVYRDLKIPSVYSKFEEETFAELSSAIRKSSDIPASLFMQLMNKIYKRLS